MIRKVEFYTDGAFSSKSEMGGGACVCIEDNIVIQEESGYEPYSTNNRMELMAIQCAFETASAIETGQTKVIVYTDSAYAANAFNQQGYINGIKNGGKTADKQDVKNQDLGKPLVASYIRLKDRFDLEIIKVKSHAGDRGNSYADLLAVKARKELEI